MNNICTHKFDPELSAKKLFLSKTFTKVWVFLAEQNCLASKICLCLECQAVFRSGKRIDKHIEETGHNLTLLLHPFRVYCRTCHQYQLCP